MVEGIGYLFILLAFLIIVFVFIIALYRYFIINFKEQIPVHCEVYGLPYYGSEIPNAWKIIKSSELAFGFDRKISDGVGQPSGDLEVITFEYQTTTKGERSSTIHTYCITIMEFPFKQKGTLLMRKECGFDKMDAFLGKNDLDFENKEFSDIYYVVADPPQFAYRFFHPRMIELFLEYRQYSLFIKDVVIMIYRKGGIQNKHAILDNILGRFPFSEWMDESKNILMLVDKNIPQIIRRKENSKRQNQREKAKEDEVVLAELADEPKSVGLTCPKCRFDFDVAEGQRLAKCPHCGAEGEV
jgi:hypothetical protein